MTIVSKNRLKNVSHSRPIIYGSYAALLKTGEKRADPSHTHKWTVYVKGIQNEDLAVFIKKVSFKLHESFESPLRVLESPPFEVHETGWGEFDIAIKIYIHEELESVKHIQLHHTLQLYPKEDAATASNKPVVSEHYEEIVFNEPTEETYNKLSGNPPPMLTGAKREKVTHSFTPHAEQEELKSLREANDKVLQQLENEKARLQAAEDELETLKRLVGDDA
ncbi:hypothetical protein SpCBS45565_g04940 [Spizellomyces sp. 'palustris']|nr:hypothetical protein SpCBS45565_g04940 [Spizellomyces sp. 'palustris']